MTKINKPYYFKQLEEDNYPFKLICWPRRAGKSTYLTQQIIKGLANKETILLLGPSLSILDIVKLNIIDEVKENPFVTKLEVQNNKLIVNDGTLIIDNTYNVRGYKIDRILIEEAALMSYKQFTYNLLPLLADTPTEMIFTPRIYTKDKVPLVKDLWDNCSKWEHYTTDYKSLPDWRQIRDDFKPTLDDDIWRTEFLAEWVEPKE